MVQVCTWKNNTTDKYIALLVPEIMKSKIEQYYLPLLNKFNILAIPLLKYKKKTPASDIKQYLNEEVNPLLVQYNCTYVLVADAEYFKVIRKVTKPDAYIGYIYTDTYKYVYVPNYKLVFYHPDETKEKINRSIQTVINDINHSYSAPGSNIIKSEYYPDTLDKIKESLNSLYNYPALTCDIETYSLKHINAGLGSICFCWNQNEGIAFKIDNSQEVKNEPVREVLKDFFINYKGTLIFHNIAFDVTVLIYQLFMKDNLDQEGLLNGLDIMLRNFDDTKLITYLCTNSCSGNNLSLKYQAQEYAGNWAQEEITNLSAIPLEELLRYNLIDGLATWFVFDKYKDKLVQDKQKELYENIFKPTTKDIIQMQLTGIPLNYDKVLEAEAKLNQDKELALSVINSSKWVKDYINILNQRYVEKYNSSHKKQISIQDANESFNPNSGKQLQDLLYNQINLPIINLTESKQPATDGDTLKALLSHTQDKTVLNLLQALIDFSAVEKILTAFIPQFKQAEVAKDGRRYLYGNFNLGGTVSGRLSSSKPKHIGI